MFSVDSRHSHNSVVMEWDIHCDELAKRFLGADHLLHLTETTSDKVVDGTNGTEQYLKCKIRICKSRNATQPSPDRTQICNEIQAAVQTLQATLCSPEPEWSWACLVAQSRGKSTSIIGDSGRLLCGRASGGGERAGLRSFL